MPIQLSGSLVITGSITTTGVILMSGSIASASYSSTSDLLQGTGSVGFATTASLLAVSSSQQQISSSQQQISASLLNVVANYATTGSNSFRANQSITGSLVVSSTITAQTLVVQTVTSSILYSSGSNNFGNQLSNNQTFTGSVNITGSLALAGNITSNGTAVMLGTGSANYLPKFTAASTIGNSLVVDNGTNIGIGTTNPTAGRLQINVSDTTTAAHFQIVDGTTTLANSFVTNFRNANDGDGRYSLSRWQVQNAVGNDQIGFIGVQSITGAGAYTPNIIFGQRTGVSTYATRMTLDSSGNLGIGVTPSAWALGTTLQIGNIYGTINFSGTAAIFGIVNAYYNGSSYLRQNTGSAASYEYNIATSNCFAWRMSASDTAGTTAALPIVATLSSNGFEVGYTSVQGTYKLDVNGTGRFASSVQATTLALGSVTPSTNGIYLNNATANGANYGYIRTNALTVNTTQLILGSTYGYNTPVDALTIFNGSTTFANSITAPSLYGNSYAQTSTSGTTSFVNTGIFYNTSITGFANNAIYNLVISGNPNGAGSSEYRSVYLGYIFVTTGYDFGISSVVQRISYTQVVTGDAYNIGALTISVVFWNGTTETTQQINGTTNNQIRVKITGYNSGNIGAAQTVLITKVN